MINGFGKWISRAVWESGLVEQLERVAVKVKYKVEKKISMPRNLGEYRGRVALEGNWGDRYRREALDH